MPAGYWGGEGDDVVALVDNIRDPNYYDVNDPVGYLGFFYSVFNEIHDRNIITVDSFDWLHRSGANPPDEPVPGDPCTSASARPFLIESTFAHEYQHLLEYYEDPAELSWVNEGLSMWAETLSGYADLAHADHRDRARALRPVLPRLHRRADARQPAAAPGRTGERADGLGRPGRRGDRAATTARPRR